VIVGIALCLVGLVWIGQGIGAIGGSFMSGQAIWAVIGAVVVIFGVVLMRGGRSRSDR
jgi:hypothetical protein